MATATVGVFERLERSPPVITAKVCPALLPPHVVARPRLVDRLARPGWRIASITAGPGLGKSVLLLQWLATQDHDQFAVLTLDQADNDSERFWRYVVAALQRTRPRAFE